MEKLELNRSKLPWHHGRVNWWLDGDKIAPITIDMALTRACNFRCTYCYGQLQENPGTMGWETIRNAFDDFALSGVRAVSLVSDGESTCSPHWRKAILHGKVLGLNMALGTNGALLDPDPLVLGALTYLRFNISAAHPQVYAKVHGTGRDMLSRVAAKIATCVAAKERLSLPVTIGMQMVFLPELENQVLPLAQMAIGLGVDYLVIKHCSDDEEGSLGVDYEAIKGCRATLEQAEKLSTSRTTVAVKWGKIGRGNTRPYRRCLAPPFHLQISGSGLVAPCGMFFGEKYKDFWIGNLNDERFRDMLKGRRYWRIMHKLASRRFNAQKQCGCLCLQDESNIWLNKLLKGEVSTKDDPGPEPPHINFL